MIRWFVMLLLFFTSPIAAQVAPVGPPAPDRLAPAPPTAIQVTPPLPSAFAPPPVPAPAPRPIRQPTPGYWPAYDYITIGQDEPGYRLWVAADPNRPALVKSFNDYLVAAGVGGVAPTWQMLRTASQWKRCDAEPFEIPPTEGWPNIVAALRYVGAFVMPRIGVVEPVSVYRNPALNRCAGGAGESTHRTVGAIDMVPRHRISREALMTALCQLHQDSGTWNNVGLGLYKGVRFHVDAKKFREWGSQGAGGGWGCGAVLAQGPMPFGGAVPPSAVPTAATPIAAATTAAATEADPLAPIARPALQVPAPTPSTIKR